MKPLLNDCLGQVGEAVPVLLNTPTSLPFQVPPMILVPSDWKWTNQPLVSTQAEKERVERILNISKNPINSQTIQLLKGQGSERVWGFRQQELREKSILESQDSSLNSREKRCDWPSLGFVPQMEVDRDPWLAEDPIKTMDEGSPPNE